MRGSDSAVGARRWPRRRGGEDAVEWPRPPAPSYRRDRAAVREEERFAAAAAAAAARRRSIRRRRFLEWCPPWRRRRRREMGAERVRTLGEVTTDEYNRRIQRKPLDRWIRSRPSRGSW